jgi:hypothetical protein
LAAASLAIAAPFGLPGWTWIAAGSLAVVGLAGLTFTSVSAKVTVDGLRIAYGPLRWPSRRVPLQRIERAWAEERFPSDVGGLGYRLGGGWGSLPHNGATIMIRGGECLVVRYASGRELAVSVDDAARGAALLNTLAATHPHA